MPNIVGATLEGVVAAVDAVAPKLGVSAGILQAFNDATGVIADEVNGASNKEIVTDIAIGVAVTMFVPEELVAAAGGAALTSLVGEEGVIAAAAAVNEALATTIPGAFSLSAGDVVVGTASKFLGTLVVNAAAIPAFSQWLSAATEVFSSPSSVSLSNKAASASLSNETAAVISDGGAISIGGNSLPTIFNLGNSPGIVNVTTTPLTVTNIGAISGGIGAGGPACVTNLGSINGFNGLSVAGGSTIINGSASNTTASITATNLSISTGAGSLANFGKIAGNIQMSGTITNGSAADTVASIAGFIGAIGVTTLGNFGSISGGVSMVAAGGNTVTNGSNADTTALISGTVGIGTAGGPASTINNFGTITGTYQEGIRAGGTANITNGSTSDTKALIQGGVQGWGIALNAGSVTNYGTVKGGLGCISLGSGTITNAGVLASATPTGTAIQFGSGTNKLIEKAGASISGTVFGGGSLELANDGTPVTMAANISVGTLIVDPGTTWSVAAHANVPNIFNNGTVAIASGGSLDVSSAVDPSSTGAFQLMTKASLELGAILGSALKIQFLGSGPTNELTIDNASKFGTNVGKASYAGPLLENFAAGDVIDVRGIGSTGLALNYSAASGDLQITGSSGTALATLAFQNSTLGSGTSFHAAADPFGGALITHS